MLHHNHGCDKEGCNRYADIDIYLSDGMSAQMCAEHAWKEPGVLQGVPKHGSDNVNVEMETNANQTT